MINPGVKTHGKTQTAEYRVWSAMKRRCLNPNVIGFDKYGERGITICDRWINSFEAFLEDMGERPPMHTIERVDNALGYSPDNCTWATRKEQASNTRRNHNITFEGITKTLTQWAEYLGLKQSTIRQRMSRGWSIKQALTIPLRPGRAL